MEPKYELKQQQRKAMMNEIIIDTVPAESEHTTKVIEEALNDAPFRGSVIYNFEHCICIQSNEEILETVINALTKAGMDCHRNIKFYRFNMVDSGTIGGIVND